MKELAEAKRGKLVRGEWTDPMCTPMDFKGDKETFESTIIEAE